MFTISKIKQVSDNIKKGFYVDNPQNRRLGRVGMGYDGDAGNHIKDSNLEASNKGEFRRLTTPLREKSPKIGQIMGEINKLYMEEEEAVGGRRVDITNQIKELIWQKTHLSASPYLKEQIAEEVNEARKFYSDRVPRADFYEQSALDSYTGSDYRLIRAHISNNQRALNYFNNLLDKQEIEEVVGHIPVLDNYIDKNRIEENLILYRVVDLGAAKTAASLNKENSLKFFGSLEVGDIYEDISFSSTSLREIESFGTFTIEIEAEAGTNVANANNVTELEYLIGRNAKFEVVERMGDLGIRVKLLKDK